MENDVIGGTHRSTKKLIVSKTFIERTNNIFHINRDHSGLMALHFYSQFLDGTNTDFVISANGQDHKCHSFIVDFNSERIKKVSKQVKRFNINNVSTFGVRAVLDFFYRGQIHGIDYLRHDKGKQILYVAKELQAFQVYVEFRNRRSDIFRTFARENGIDFEITKSPNFKTNAKSIEELSKSIDEKRKKAEERSNESAPNTNGVQEKSCAEDSGTQPVSADNTPELKQVVGHES